MDKSIVCGFLAHPVYLHILTHIQSSFVPFYRAMHYIAKRGLVIACRLSVHPSVTLVDHDHIG